MGRALGTGLALAIVTAYITAGLERSLRDLHTGIANDRRAPQATMDTFRADILRLAERKARLEARRTAAKPPRRAILAGEAQQKIATATTRTGETSGR